MASGSISIIDWKCKQFLNNLPFCLGFQYIACMFEGMKPKDGQLSLQYPLYNLLEKYSLKSWYIPSNDLASHAKHGCLPQEVAV